MTDTNNTVTVDEWLIMHLVLANNPDASPTEAIDTLRLARTNADLVAQLHGVTLDEPVGPERAATILAEAAKIMQAGVGVFE